MLIEIISRDYQLAVQKAEADLAAAQSAEKRPERRADPSTTSKSGLTAAEAGTNNAKAAMLAADRKSCRARESRVRGSAQGEAAANATRAA